jgi:EsV-1-7 cysteine-rich motif
MMQVRQYCAHHAVDIGVAVLLGPAARCINHEECKKYATFGYKGKPAIYCKACIPEELKDKLIDVIDKRCEIEGCNTHPTFGDAQDRVSATIHHYSASILLHAAVALHAATILDALCTYGSCQR